jgi:hypothetical protein
LAGQHSRQVGVTHELNLALRVSQKQDRLLFLLAVATVPHEMQDVIAFFELRLQRGQRARLRQADQLDVQVGGHLLERGPLGFHINRVQTAIGQVLGVGDNGQHSDGTLQDGAARVPLAGQVAGERRGLGRGQVLRGVSIRRVAQQFPGDGV